MWGTLSYLITALAAGIACAVLLTRSRKGDITRRGALACAVTVIWALVIAGQALMGASGHGSRCRRGAALWGLVRRPACADAAVHPVGSSASLALVLGLVVLFDGRLAGQYIQLYSLTLDGATGERPGSCWLLRGWWRPSRRCATRPVAWCSDMRWCAAGVGGQFAFDLFLYSQAQLLGAIDAGAWAMRGLVAALLLIPFTLGAWRMPASDAARVRVAARGVLQRRPSWPWACICA